MNSAEGDSPFTLDDLKLHLKDGRFSSEWLFQVYVIQKRSHLFSRLPDGFTREMEFRSDIATTSGLTMNEVNIVGSAQVGFSIKPKAKLRKLDEIYKTTNKLSDRSDIDVAIVSRRYFDKVHDDLRDFTRGFKASWKFNAFYPDSARLAHVEVKRADHQFYQYLARGWIRPDFAPDAFQFGFSVAVDKWKRLLNRKVSVGIYREWKFLKDYQSSAFERLREMAIKDEL